MIRWAYLLRGAWRFRRGPDRDQAEARRVAAICATCEHLTVHEMPLTERLMARLGFVEFPYVAYCGEPGRPRGETCGCGVLAETTAPTEITVEGRRMEPALKTTKEREWCDRWGCRLR